MFKISEMLNVNVGVLGHIDSGKTSLARALSTVSSTAAFDKSPQSHERGITLDLGFSSFCVDVSDDPAFASAGITKLQVTLVDCPGHASLIRTVIGGALIVDLMMLVVDATKGVQTQTAECLVVGEVIAKPLMVILNKVDAVQGASDDDKCQNLAKMRKRLRATMTQTRWPTAPILDVAADPGALGVACDPATRAETPSSKPIGLEGVISQIKAMVDPAALVERREVALRQASKSTGKPAAGGGSGGGDFFMFVDHCFAVKGQGTVLTGTVTQGALRVGDDLVLPDYQATRRVKSIQVFRKPVECAVAGDRIGVCITQFDANDMERGVACGGNTTGVCTAGAFVMKCNKVRYHKRLIEAGDKFHVSVGHVTVMGTLKFFKANEPNAEFCSSLTKEYAHLDRLPDESALQYTPPAPSSPPGTPAAAQASAHTYFAVVLLDRPITLFPGATVICSHLDSDVHANVCRLGIMGTVVFAGGFLEAHPDGWRSIPAVRHKHRRVILDRVEDARTCIVNGLIKLPERNAAEGAPKESQRGGRGRGARPQTAPSADSRPVLQIGRDIQKFVGMHMHAVIGKCELPEDGPPPTAAVVGRIDSAFGQSGKARVIFPADIFTLPAPKGSKPITEPASSQVTDGCDVKAPQKAVTKAPPKVAIYLFTKKFPFAAHNATQPHR